MTEQAAERMGVKVREFRDYASQHRLPKRKIGNRVCYTLEVILAAAEERREQDARKAAEKEAAAEKAKESRQRQPIPQSVEMTVAVPALDRSELLRQALAACQAQTALIDRIVQNIGAWGESGNKQEWPYAPRFGAPEGERYNLPPRLVAARKTTHGKPLLKMPVADPGPLAGLAWFVHQVNVSMYAAAE